jgi:hypothetical protein
MLLLGSPKLFGLLSTFYLFYCPNPSSDSISSSSSTFLMAKLFMLYYEMVDIFFSLKGEEVLIDLLVSLEKSSIIWMWDLQLLVPSLLAPPTEPD